MIVLVTGGAGFIGSNLVDALTEAGHRVRVLDDLNTGRRENLPPTADLRVGSVADPAAVADAVEGAEIVFHLAAHGAVARSLESPLSTDTSNVHGTLTVLKAALDGGTRRVVFSSSSSVYGGAAQLPTPEDAPLLPRSPYAVSKLAGEHYCRVFAELFEIETVALRFFNVFGPRQRPDSAYAAVIPLFTNALLSNERPTVHGDGRQSRDFTYVSDVAAALLAASRAPAGTCSGRVYNVAGGRSHDLLELLSTLGGILGVEPRPRHVSARAGDVRVSMADVRAAKLDLGFSARCSFEDGLSRTVDWMMKNR